MPLVDRAAPDAVVAAWFDHLATDSTLPSVMLLPYLPTDGPLAQVIDTVLARRGGRSLLFNRHQRALLAPEPNERVGYLERALGSKKRKELRRQRKRLGDSGVVMRGSTNAPDAVPRAIDDFLALEAGGWKGRAGTAARSDADIRAFLEAAVIGLAEEGKARIDRLFSDTRAIATMILLRSGADKRGATTWAWKVAYDERFARASPGVQLLTDVTQTLLDDESIARADSCAAADHPMIDHVWRERLPLADWLIGVRRGDTATFACARTLETLRRGGVAAAKAARDLLRR
jgi:hypothetical protein